MSVAPRCLVTNDQVYPNGAFEALPARERDSLVRAAQDSEILPFVDAAGYRFAVVPLEPLGCVLLTGVPLETATADVASWPFIRSAGELTRHLAASLTEHVADWACVHIVDDDGTPYVWESPERESVVLPQLPDFFLAGYSIFKPHADDEFYGKISKDPEARDRLEALGAISGAALPIVAHGALIGCAIALSLRHVYDADDFQHISSLVAGAGRAFEQMKRAATYQAETYSGLDSDARVAISVTPAAIEIELSGPGETHLSGYVEIQRGILHFEADAIAEPLMVNRQGAVPVLPLRAHERSVTLAPGSIVLLYPSSLAAAVRETGVAATLQQLALKEQWSVKEMLAQKLGSGCVFAAITAGCST